MRPSSVLLGAAAMSALAAAGAAPQTTISESRILGHIKVLASDEFEGRAPGSRGEAKTIAYLQQQFVKLGLAPGNPDGSYLQKVPMLGVKANASASLEAGGKSMALKFPDDYVAFSVVEQAEVKIDKSELVFVGYGVQAPEYNWDDYKGVDVRGKTIVMLINDPPLPDPLHPEQLDPAMFKGKGMTWYGRWDYKFAIAAKLGAAAAIIVHETVPAAYPYGVVRNSWGGENFDLKGTGPNPNFPAVSAWIQLDRAKELASAAGLDFETLKKSALSRDFRPVSLKGSATFHLKNTVRSVLSHNVVGRIEGSDPTLKAETVIYSAHWDHLGIDEALPGKRSGQIYHGALDNASGIGALLETARAFKALPKAPKRSILFIATTAEERGLLGARYYVEHPLYPLAGTVADINFDGVNAWGKTAQIDNVTEGHSTLDETLSKYARLQGRTSAPDARPEMGSFYRADQLEFAKKGIPVLYTKGRTNYIGKPPAYAREMIDGYAANDYHKVSDNVRPNWNFSGAVEDITLLYQVGLEVANDAGRPQWKDGSEFKPRNK